MTDPQASPISQLLYTLGITREDLMKRSDQMRQFLTADDAMSSRVFELENTRPPSGTDLQSNSKLVGPSRSFARSLSRTSSSSLRAGTPTTPVKSEPHDPQLPHRRMDSMEMVIERQRRQRKSRKGRERESSRNRHHPPSPSPSNASQSGLTVKSTQVRDDPKTTDASVTTEVQGVPPENNPMVEWGVVTPPTNRYYREHTNLSAQQPPKDGMGAETPTPTRPVTQSVLKGQPLPPYYAYPALIGYQHYLPVAFRAMQSSTIPVTPQANRTHNGKLAKLLLPPSSPPPVASSPISSPVRRIVNLVSSPGPMGPDPRETEYDDLPYKLPPGPYLTTKPDLSYAALIGRAILSSPEHRLTLQEIYDWITIVHPYYKRGETTWMNSIRHVLSTTVVFRKVPRDRSVGRTLWAIYDEDLECFKDGGFKKHLCKDYSNGNDGKGKGKTRKRTEDDDIVRKGKRIKKDVTSAGPSTESNIVHSSFLGRSNPLFPCVRPSPHLQPYYQSCLPQPSLFPTVPADIIFPPLPASAALSRIANASNGSSASLASTSNTRDANSTESNVSSPPTTLSRSSPTPISSTASSSSVPELTPNRNSSSPPCSMPPTSDIDVNMCDPPPPEGVLIPAIVSEPTLDSASGVVDEDSIFNTTLLGPVKFWRNSPKGSSTLQPGLDLLNFDDESDQEDSSLQVGKGKKFETDCRPKALPPVPTSPTPCLRAKRPKADVIDHLSTSLFEPSTPPRTTHKISSMRTPISHRGLQMSPSTSLAHYKSNLDPPPVVSNGIVPLEISQKIPNEEDADPLKTPRRRANLSHASISGHPMTPKKLIFSNAADSPFRTPRLRAVYDPIDPRSVLDDELNRIDEDSPAGLYGKERSSLLYDSPGLEGYKWW